VVDRTFLVDSLQILLRTRTDWNAKKDRLWPRETLPVGHLLDHRPSSFRVDSGLIPMIRWLAGRHIHRKADKRPKNRQSSGYPILWNGITIAVRRLQQTLTPKCLYDFSSGEMTSIKYSFPQPSQRCVTSPVRPLRARPGRCSRCHLIKQMVHMAQIFGVLLMPRQGN
jgi:hypothetical protein